MIDYAKILFLAGFKLNSNGVLPRFETQHFRLPDSTTTGKSYGFLTRDRGPELMSLFFESGLGIR